MAIEMHVREAGTGTPVVLLHAFPLSSAMWDRSRDALAAGCHLITPDLRGFGRTPLGASEPSLERLADDVCALLDDRGLDRAVVGGVSMGGYVTMAFLRRHPERVSGVVLADTKATADDEAARAKRERIARTILEEHHPRVLLEDVLPTLLGDTTRAERPEVLGDVQSMVESAPAAAVAWAQRAMARRPDSTATLREVGVPALVVVGDEDALSPVAAAQQMADALPKADLVTIPGAGHLSPVERPDAFAAAVLDWLPRAG